MARRPKSLGEKVMMSAFAAFGDHLWENNPEVRQLANAFGFTHPMPKPRREVAADEPEPKRRKPKRRWQDHKAAQEEPSDGEEIVIELVKKPDGSFGAP